jgi:hypothetical protein
VTVVVLTQLNLKRGVMLLTQVMTMSIPTLMKVRVLSKSLRIEL